MEKTYFIGGIDYLNRSFGADISYEMLQSALVGDAISYDNKLKYKHKLDSAFYFITAHDKHREKLDNGQKIKVEYFYEFWLVQESFNIYRQAIRNPIDTTSLDVTYEQYMTIDTDNFPQVLTMEIESPKDTIKMEMKNSKVKRNEKVTFPFRITDKYTRIEWNSLVT